MSSFHEPPRMSGEDLLRLESILAREDFSDNTMPLETLDGFLSALIVGPELQGPPSAAHHS